MFDFVRMNSGYALRALAVSAIISVCVGVYSCGFGQERPGWCSLARWSTMGRSKMERHEQYVWMVGGEHMSWRRQTSLDGSLHFLSFTMAHSEGGLGMGMKALGQCCFM